MARKITNAKRGVSVKIEGENAVKVLKVIEKTKRSFSSEVNVAVEEKMDERILKFKDNGK